MKKNIIIFGSSGHALEIFQCVNIKKDYNFLGFVEKNKSKNKNKNKIYCYDNDIKKLSKKNIFGIVGVYDLALRKKIVKKIFSINPNFKFTSIISKNSFVSKKSKIGINVFIANGAIINSNSVIKDHTVINTGAIVEHDCIVNEFVNISPNSTILGNTTISEEVFIGAGSVINKNILIERKNIIDFGNPANLYEKK